MTNPPPGKVWITLEMTQHEWDTGDFEYCDLDFVGELEGPEPEEDPSDKTNRLLGNAENFFREAANAFQPHKLSDGSGPMAIVHGCQALADALKVYREEL